MPSLILTGYPCTGKTTFANLLSKRAKQHKSNLIQNVIIINEQSARPDKSLYECYQSSQEEKLTRSALKTEFDKYVSKNNNNNSSSSISSGITKDNTLVILDSLNYIKGFRYELHCISKAAGTKHGVIWLICNENKVMQWNDQRCEDSKKANENCHHHNYYYTKEMMNELISRYEPPDQRNRWDRPLYRVDVKSTLHDEKEVEKETVDNNNNDNDDETGKAAEKVLKKSVYNMHSLSDAIKDSSQSTAITSNKQLIAASSSFKRGVGVGAGAGVGEVNHENNVPTVATVPTSINIGSSGVTTKTTATKTPTTTTSTSSKRAGRSSFRRVAPRITTHNDDENNSSNETIIPPTQTSNTTTTTTSINIKNHHHNEKKREVKKMEDLIDSILDSFLLDVEPLKEGQSTKISKAASSNVLNDVDSVSQDMVSSFIVAQQKQQNSGFGGAGGSSNLVVPIPSSSSSSSSKAATIEGNTFTLKVNRTIQIGEMKRLRRQYITWVKDNPPRDTSYVGIATSFLSFVQSQI